MKLCFQDGGSEFANALIGADGIFGFAQGYVLGEDAPATKPISGSWWDCTDLVSIEKAREKVGEQYFEQRRFRQREDG